MRLDTLLGEFFVKANVGVLWNKYKSLLDSINFSYEPYSIKALDDIVNFCGIKEDFYNDYAEDIIFNVCPLMSHFQNFNYRVNKTLYLIDGPGDGKPGPDVFYHEALHPSISPIIDKYKDYVVGVLINI